MRISAIVAMSENRVIGVNNEMPWHLPADLKYFKKITMGKPILMGRKTYESIGKALPGRCNVVITRNKDFQAPGCVVANSIATALTACEYSDELFVIGGELLYQQMLPKIQRLYLTVVHLEVEGDASFPELNMDEWQEVDNTKHPKDDENKYAFDHIVLDRKK